MDDCDLTFTYIMREDTGVQTSKIVELNKRWTIDDADHRKTINQGFLPGEHVSNSPVVFFWIKITSQPSFQPPHWLFISLGSKKFSFTHNQHTISFLIIEISTTFSLFFDVISNAIALETNNLVTISVFVFSAGVTLVAWNLLVHSRSLSCTPKFPRLGALPALTSRSLWDTTFCQGRECSSIITHCAVHFISDSSDIQTTLNYSLLYNQKCYQSCHYCILKWNST